MIDKGLLKRRFSKNAKNYDEYANIQKIMGDHLLERVIPQGIKFKNILEIGCGTGYVTKKLLELFPDAKVTAVDLAPGMIEYVKSTIYHKNIQFICGDIEEMRLEDSYDLIISNATFQWFNQLEKTLETLLHSLKSDGCLAFSTFGKNNFRELHQSSLKAKKALGIKSPMNIRPSFLSLEELEELCDRVLWKVDQGKTKVHISEAFATEHFENCRDFLFSVKKIGANNATKDSKPINVEFTKKVMDIYDREYREEDKVKATYHQLFVSIKRK